MALPVLPFLKYASTLCKHDFFHSIDSVLHFISIHTYKQNYWMPFFILTGFFELEYYFSSNHILLAILLSVCSPCPQVFLPILLWLLEHFSSGLGHENTCQSVANMQNNKTLDTQSTSSYWIRVSSTCVTLGPLVSAFSIYLWPYFPPFLVGWVWNC